MPLMDQEISGSGEFAFAVTTRVDFITVELTALGPGVQNPSSEVADYVVKAGWVALGADNMPSSTAGVYWRTPQWINFPFQLFDDQTANQNSSHLRWHLSEGTVAHIVASA